MNHTTTILLPSREPIELDFLYTPIDTYIRIDGKLCFIEYMSDSIISGRGIERSITVKD